ncbi:hypothetical protein CsSME_00013154 [Camellia sinensis var. sinensis]
MTVTRPYLVYVVHVVSQFVFAPCSTHWAVLVRILCYLQDIIFQGLLLFFTSSLDLVAYANFDWTGDVTDRKSTFSFCMFLGNSLIFWKSKKQTIVARFTAEAEYRAMAHVLFKLHITLSSKSGADTVFLSPPWGGPNYTKVTTYDMKTMLKPHDGHVLFNVARGIASKVVMFLPRNVDFNQLAELSLSANPPWSLEVEKNFLNGKLKAITAYFTDTSSV